MSDINNENIENTEAIERSEKKYSKALKIIGIIAAVAIIMILIVSFMGRPYNKADNTYVDVTISYGSTTSDVAKTLKDNGIIGSEANFKFLSTVRFYNNKFKPGIYSLSPSMSVAEIANTIINGIRTETGFTLPAGYTIDQTAEALEVAGFVSKDKFIEIASSGIFSDLEIFSNIPAGKYQLEGYLMPGHYEMSKDADEVQIIVTMLNQFNNSFTDEYKNRAVELGLSVQDIVIIASIIQKETSNENEMADISQVIHNRLKAGLEPLGGAQTRPVCSPSIEAIKAALYPSEGNNMFYVLNSKLNGKHVFVANESEYNELKAEYDAAIAEKKKDK